MGVGNESVAHPSPGVAPVPAQIRDRREVMNHMKRTMGHAFAALAFGAVLALPSPAPASADTSGGGANNVVTVLNTSGTMLRGHAEIGFFGGDNTQSSNVATALSHDCTGCHSRAVAVQEVVLTGSPSSVSPTNAATAVNSACEGCDTVAYAYQNVFWSTNGASLAPGARQQAAELTARIAVVAADDSVSDVPFVDSDGRVHSDLTDALDALARQLDLVVEQGLVATGTTIVSNEAHRQVRAGAA